MRTKTLPLPAAPLRFHSLRIQPLLHFRFSLLIPARLQELLHSHPRALPPAAPHRFHSLRIHPLLHFRFSLLIPARLQELLHPHPRALPPAAPHRFHSLRIQPLLHFRFSLLIPPRLQELLHPHPRALPPRLLPEPRRSLLPQWRLLRQRLPVPPPLPQGRRCSRRHLWSQPLRRLRRSDSRPDKFCPPSFRRCRESPSTAPGSCRRVFRRW